MLVTLSNTKIRWHMQEKIFMEIRKWNLIEGYNKGIFSAIHREAFNIITFYSYIRSLTQNIIIFIIEITRYQWILPATVPKH